MNFSDIAGRIVSGVLISLVLLGAYSVPAFGDFAITYYDNYNYDTGQWDPWQSIATPLNAWDAKYLPIDPLKTVFTDHAFASIATFDLRGGLFSKDVPAHATGGEDWNPLQSIGDNVSGQSAHHVFAALFTGLVYLVEGDVLSVTSDDDVYVFLDGATAWGQQVLSIDHIAFFETDSMTVNAAQAGYHVMTVRFIERQDIHSGIEMKQNGEHLQNAGVVVIIDIKPGSWPNAINQGSNGVIPVAIFSSPEFDATSVDSTTVELGGASVAMRGKAGKSMAHVEDVDGDGLLDLVVQVETEAAGLWTSGDVILTGETFDGQRIGGYDAVVIVPGNG